MYNLPDIMTFDNGTPVLNAEDFEKRKKEIIRLLSENVFGYVPNGVPSEFVVDKIENKCCSGNAEMQEGHVVCRFEESDFTFPLKLVLPKSPGKKTLIVLINFDESIFCRYLPLEEVIDNDFALAYIWYNDIALDNSNDFNELISKYFDRNEKFAAGKISLWAWGVSRAIDALYSHDKIDNNEIALMGHSRLGKTALWCGANDERIKYVCSNDSGCMGAALERFKHEGAETLNDIYDRFPFWFCPEFASYYDNTQSLPVDMHFLVAANAPRYVLINSAGDNAWADPTAEQQTCIETTPAWKIYGKEGFLGSKDCYSDNDGDLNGDIGYYKRSGIHFLGRKDWQNFMRFIRMKQGK